MKRTYYWLLFYVWAGCTHSIAYAQQDTFTYDTYLQIVSQQHPIAQQIRLLQSKAEQELQRAKGNFDPQLATQWDGKQFNGSRYYSLFNSSVKVPTWWGVEVEGGYLHNYGTYLSPSDKTPYDGHAYLGINVPLLNGLLTNERRTAVEQARLLQATNQAQIRTYLNDLLYESAKAYWEWAFAYNEVTIWEQSAALSVQRLAATKEAFVQGDKPAMDTLESFANLQDRLLRLQESRLDLQQARLALNNYLWATTGQPLELAPNARPQMLTALAPLDSAALASILTQLPNAHPDIQLYRFQLQNLAIEGKLKANKQLPKLDLKYNLLAYNGADFFYTGADALAENYKWGVKFSMPLLLRQSRADYQLNQIKIRETQFKLDQKGLELANKVRNYFAEVNNYTAQVAILQNNVDNYQRLLAAEQDKFQLGESSVFLLNSRELKVVETQQKLYATLAKLAKARASLAWAAAQLQ